MKRIIKIFAVIADICLGLGLVVSKMEKKQGRVGWVKGHKCGFYEREIKRPLDFGLSLMAVILFWPLLLIFGIAIRINIGTPIFFTQPRPGLGEKIFYIKKYRTMAEVKDESGELLPDEKRMTEFGKRMRAASLDELMELFNIIKGDMSIVGPRPQLVCDMVFMSKEHRRRHDIRPGLTGLAQISGRNGICWEDRLDKDLEYIENITFFGDMKIILQTVMKVLIKDGINEKGQVTALDYGEWLLINGRVSQEEYVKKQKEAGRLLEK